MTVSQHTAGPWIYYADLPSAEPNWHIVTTANKMRVLANVHIEPGNRMDEANARLIAAAPELLEAAKRAEDVIDDFLGHLSHDEQADDPEVGQALVVLRAAIAKAVQS